METKIVFDKPSLWQRIFGKEKAYSKKRTLYDFVMYLFELHHESRSLFGYIRENWKICDDLNRYPSKKIFKRYNLNHDISNMFVWWLMEQYFEGNLVLKEPGIEKKDKETHG